MSMSEFVADEFGEPTSKLRGSQKSKSDSEAADREIGEGEGESEGQEAERRSEAWLAVTEGGWMNTKNFPRTD